MSDAAIGDPAVASSEAERVDRRAQALLAAAYDHGSAHVFSCGDAPALAVDKKAADRLVQLRLAAFLDETRDTVTVTNSGRYWSLNGGYMAFLKEEPPVGGGRGRNPELEAIRFTYMKLRLNTFWLTLGMSIAGFVISIVSLCVAYYFGGSLGLGARP